MVRALPTNLATAVEADVTSIALLVEIRRQDGVAYFLTNHDNDITYLDQTYRSDIAFNCSSIASGTSLNVDNLTIQIALDGVVFTRSDFTGGKFLHAEVIVRKVDFNNPSYGSILLRKGWFASIEYNQQGFADITIVGMLKALEFEVGRTVSPSCDADLGDKRCKYAIDYGQAHSPLNVYYPGDWVYVYDTTVLNSFTVTNPGFEADGTSVTSPSPLTGWTWVLPEYGKLNVNGTAAPGDVFWTPYSGSYMLCGAGETTFQRGERAVYQDLDLVAGGISSTDIDNGLINFLYFVTLSQTTYLLDLLGLKMEMIDASGNVIETTSTGFLALDDVRTWRDRSLGTTLAAGTRTIRIWIQFFLTDGLGTNTCADNVRCYWWDNSVDDPNNSVVHKVSRTFDAANENYQKFFTNGSFEAIGIGTMVNSNTTAITGWTRPNTTADYWSITGTYLSQTPGSGIRLLRGGDNGSAIQSSYELEQTIDLVNDWGLDAALIDIGRYVGLFSGYAFFFNTTSSLYVHAEIQDATFTPIAYKDLFGTSASYLTDAGAPSKFQLFQSVVIPYTARYLKITLVAKSPVGVSAAEVGFDDFRMSVLDVENPDQLDPPYAQGSAATAFSTSPGSYTIDGDLVWKAVAQGVQYDVVATVTDRKQFTGTSIAGADTVYTGALIKWLSGNNAGRKNVIRKWTSTGKVAKLYFKEPEDIQVGDRFMYVLPCQKRFLEDCIGNFDNAINFRGFPHLPGKLGTS